MVLGGGAALGRSAGISGQNPNRQLYGGSKDEYDRLRAQYQTGLLAGGKVSEDSLRNLQDQALIARNGIGSTGKNMMVDALRRPVEMDSRGAEELQAMDPGAVAQAQANAALDAAARRNIGMASNGGALGMRNAIMANADAAVNIGANVAATAAALEMQKRQALADEYARQNQIAMALRSQNLQEAGMGADMYVGGNAMSLDATQAAGSLGQGYMNSFLGAQQNMDQAQLNANIDYDTRRQAARQKKADRLWNFGTGLIGAGGKMLGSAFGGGG